ncbi:unnamed protein product [Arctogadus glacialis]
MIALKCEEMGDKRKGSTSAQTHRNSAIAITPKLPPQSDTSIIISCTTGVVRLAGGPPQKTPEIPTAESSVSYAAAARKLGFLIWPEPFPELGAISDVMPADMPPLPPSSPSLARGPDGGIWCSTPQ